MKEVVVSPPQEVIDEPNSPGQFCPISNLPSFGKVVDVIRQELQRILEESDYLIYISQVSSSIMLFYDLWQSWDGSDMFFLVFLDPQCF